MDDFDDKYRKKNPFCVPEGYFEGLTDRIVGQIEKQRKPKKMRFLQIVKSYSGVAAVFLLALLVVQAIYPVVDARKQNLETENEVVAQDTETENIFDSQFNPTSDEIIEYLVTEVDDYELIYAGIYSR